jgi:membrane associated rhomboid family serine protease
MPRRTSSELGLPPFTGAVRQIILVSTAIYVVILLAVSFKPTLGIAIQQIGMLDPGRVWHGWIWQLATYPFVADDPWRFVVSLAGIYFLGPSLESRIGPGRFWAFFFGTTVLSGVAGVVLSLTGVIAQGPAFSMVAFANAIMMAFYLINSSSTLLAFFVIPVPAKWLLIFFIALESAYLLLSHFALFYCVALLAFGAGYMWYQTFLTRRATFNFSERYYAFRNSYYRWKRRRAARKFEVYMRDHNRKVTFDEHGNYVPPDDDKHNGGSKSGWVN